MRPEERREKYRGKKAAKQKEIGERKSKRIAV